GATFACIGNIRDELAHVYVQVTATPQSLFLQTLEDPCKPQFCVVSEPGPGYVGGREFFGATRNLQCVVDGRQFDDLMSGRSAVTTSLARPRRTFLPSRHSGRMSSEYCET